MELQQQVNRLGMFTASGIYKLMAGGRRDLTDEEIASGVHGKRKTVDTLFGDGAMTYIHEKVAEIITGECKPQLSSAATAWGNEHEKDAALWLQKYVPFEYMGKENFQFFNYNDLAGGSPDGLSDTHVIELKCPYNSSNHVGWLLARNHNEWLKANYPEYFAQVQFNMMCCKKEYAYIASYDPRTVEYLHRMAILEVWKDFEYCAELDMRINEAVSIIRAKLADIESNTIVQCKIK